MSSSPWQRLRKGDEEFAIRLMRGPCQDATRLGVLISSGLQKTAVFIRLSSFPRFYFRLLLCRRRIRVCTHISIRNNEPKNLQDH